MNKPLYSKISNSDLSLSRKKFLAFSPLLAETVSQYERTDFSEGREAVRWVEESRQGRD
jgi:hypothetical protein